jgi:transcriptional regulator with XRE-family HTH domain
MLRATSDELLSQVGRRIAELRRRAGLTQAELAEAMSVSIKYEQRIENGDENLTLRSLARIAIVLDVRPAALFVVSRTRRASPGRPVAKTGTRRP